MTTVTHAMTIAVAHEAAKDCQPEQPFIDTWALTVMAVLFVGVVVAEVVTRKKRKRRAPWL